VTLVGKAWFAARALALALALVGGCAETSRPPAGGGSVSNPDAFLSCGGELPDPGSAIDADGGAAETGVDADAPTEAADAAAPTCGPERSSELDAAAAQGSWDAPAPSPLGAGDAGAEPPRVVLISVDGLRPDAILSAPAPALMDLACRGAYSWKARTIEPSVTLPSHASMVSGFLPEVHKLWHNHLQPGYIFVPTVMGLAKEAGKRVVMVMGKEKMIQLAPPQSFDVYIWAGEGDDHVADAAIAQAELGFDLMFVHFPMVDLVGHGEAWMSSAYLRQITVTDAAIGRLLKALPPHTTVIVTADHGGRDRHHWFGQPEEVNMKIPWIAHGPRIRPGHVIAQPISTVDTAATIAHLLGLELGSDATGRPVREALAD
jgi:hypothetical protein